MTTKPDELKLAYLLIATPVPNTYLGGVMVTDGRGLPLEFRYTEPIQPTRIQQILYGQVLSKYIKTEVILETLLKSLESKLKFLLVEDESLTASAKGLTVLRVAETKAPPLDGVGKTQSISATEVLVQVSREASPLRLCLPDESSVGDAAAGKPPAFVDTLVEAGQWMDVCEPLRRIERALESICQEMGLTNPSPTKS